MYGKETVNTLVFSGKNKDKSGIPVEVKRKRIKNIYLRVEPGGHALISAPASYSDGDILAFLCENEAWLFTQVKRMTNETLPGEASYETGDTFWYMGKQMKLSVYPDRKNSLCIGENTIALFMPAGSSVHQKEAFFKYQMKLRLYRHLSARLPYWEEKMNLRSSGFSIRDMKSLWGSCNIRSRKITFNLRLIEAPEAYTDYVIVHELSHLVYPNHSADFWALVASFLPDYKSLRSGLNKHDYGDGYDNLDKDVSGDSGDDAEFDNDADLSSDGEFDGNTDFSNGILNGEDKLTFF